MSRPHDILVTEVIDGRERSRIEKSDTAPRPHVRSCAGCRETRTCHVCGESLVKWGTYDGCTSGACSSCCPRHHKHATS